MGRMRKPAAAMLAAGLVLTACGADEADEQAQERIEELEQELAEAADRIAELEFEQALAAEADGQGDDDNFNGIADDDAETVSELAAVDPSEFDQAHRVPEEMFDQGIPLPEGASILSGTGSGYSWQVNFSHDANAMDAVLALYREVFEEEEGYDVAIDTDVRVDDERNISWGWNRDTYEYETDDGMELESARFTYYLRGAELSDGTAQWRVSWVDSQSQREALND